jgi:hypothetical protein
MAIGFSIRNSSAPSDVALNILSIFIQFGLPIQEFNKVHWPSEGAVDANFLGRGRLLDYFLIVTAYIQVNQLCLIASPFD